MRNASTQFAFIKASPQILPPELSTLDSSLMKLTADDRGFLKDLVESSGTSSLRLSRPELRGHFRLNAILSPCTLQLIRLALRQAQAQLSALPASVDQV